MPSSSCYLMSASYKYTWWELAMFWHLLYLFENVWLCQILVDLSLVRRKMTHVPAKFVRHKRPQRCARINYKLTVVKCVDEGPSCVFF